jgi:hypothetical protein
MAVATTWYAEFKGRQDLYQALSTRIPLSMEERVLQQALAAGAKQVVEEAKSNVGLGDPYPESRTGTLKRAIYQGRGKKSTPLEQIRIVNVRKGKRYQKSKGGSRDAYYGRMVEFGHRIASGRRKERLVRESTATTARGFERYERRRVLPVGHRLRIRGDRTTHGVVKPYPYLEPAWRVKREVAQEIVEKRLEQALRRAIKKAGY